MSSLIYIWFEVGRRPRVPQFWKFCLKCHNLKETSKIPYNDTNNNVSQSCGRLLKLFWTWGGLLCIDEMCINCFTLLSDATTRAVLVHTITVTHPSNAQHINNKFQNVVFHFCHLWYFEPFGDVLFCSPLL